MKKWLLLLFTAGFVLSGCSNENGNNSEETLSIYTTVYPLEYFTEQIGQEFVTVNSIYPPGADEHTFEPSQKDMMDLAKSDLFIYIGLGLEGFVEKARKTLEPEDVAMVAAGEHINLNADSSHSHEEGEAHEEGDSHEGEELDGSHSESEAGTDGHSHGDIDPHVWLDPLYSVQLAEAVKNALAEQLPEHEETFEKNFSELESRLVSLDKEFHEMAESAPRNDFIVSHAAYGYWEQSYGLEQISVSGLSTTSEPSQKQLQNLIAEAKEHNINYVLFEQNVSSKLAEIVKDEIGAEALTLHNLSVLTDEDIKKNRDYFTIMSENIQTLKTALYE